MVVLLPLSPQPSPPLLTQEGSDIDDNVTSETKVPSPLPLLVMLPVSFSDGKQQQEKADSSSNFNELNEQKEPENIPNIKILSGDDDDSSESGDAESNISSRIKYKKNNPNEPQQASDGMTEDENSAIVVVNVDEINDYGQSSSSCSSKSTCSSSTYCSCSSESCHTHMLDDDDEEHSFSSELKLKPRKRVQFAQSHQNQYYECAATVARTAPSDVYDESATSTSIEEEEWSWCPTDTWYRVEDYDRMKYHIRQVRRLIQWQHQQRERNSEDGISFVHTLEKLMEQIAAEPMTEESSETEKNLEDTLMTTLYTGIQREWIGLEHSCGGSALRKESRKRKQALKDLVIGNKDVSKPLSSSSSQQFNMLLSTISLNRVPVLGRAPKGRTLRKSTSQTEEEMELKSQACQELSEPSSRIAHLLAKAQWMTLSS